MHDDSDLIDAENEEHCEPPSTRALLIDDASDFDESVLASARREGPMVLPWPMPGNPAGFLTFACTSEWRAFCIGLGLHFQISYIVAAKLRRAQKLYFLGWLDFDLIKAGELVALTALELGLRDRYGDKVRDRGGQMPFAALLKYLLVDGLTDDQVPMIRRCGGSIVGLLNGDRVPSLAQIRNRQAHGDPFDGFPVAGLLELVRDLIEYAYRDWASFEPQPYFG
jgi:hypothetical protein